MIGYSRLVIPWDLRWWFGRIGPFRLDTLVPVQRRQGEVPAGIGSGVVHGPEMELSVGVSKCEVITQRTERHGRDIRVHVELEETRLGARRQVGDLEHALLRRDDELGRVGRVQQRKCRSSRERDGRQGTKHPDVIQPHERVRDGMALDVGPPPSTHDVTVGVGAAEPASVRLDRRDVAGGFEVCSWVEDGNLARAVR